MAAAAAGQTWCPRRRCQQESTQHGDAARCERARAARHHARCNTLETPTQMAARQHRQMGWGDTPEQEPMQMGGSPRRGCTGAVAGGGCWSQAMQQAAVNYWWSMADSGLLAMLPFATDAQAALVRHDPAGTTDWSAAAPHRKLPPEPQATSMRDHRLLLLLPPFPAHAGMPAEAAHCSSSGLMTKTAEEGRCRSPLRQALALAPLLAGQPTAGANMMANGELAPPSTSAVPPSALLLLRPPAPPLRPPMPMPMPPPPPAWAGATAALAGSMRGDPPTT